MFGAITVISAVTSVAGNIEILEEAIKNMTPEEKRSYLDRPSVSTVPVPEVKPSCSPWGFVLGLIVGSSFDN